MEKNHKRWADELNEMRILYEAEKEDNDFLRAKISDYLEAEVTITTQSSVIIYP